MKLQSIKANKPLNVAILDLYEGVANEGMRCIRKIIHEFADEHNRDLELLEYDVRGKNEMADLGFDVYISSGGPGSPVDSEGSDWERKYFRLMNDIMRYNIEHPERKKYVFLICHSFQIFCRHYNLGTVCKRKSTAFGVFPTHKTHAGKKESLFNQLPESFYIVDSRDWQVIQVDHDKLKQMGGHVLCLEKFRPHVDLEQAAMSIRFNDCFFGTQFHPESDPEGMLRLLMRQDKKDIVISQYGEDKYNETIAHLNDPDKIVLTRSTILPNFLIEATRHHYPNEMRA